jgi:hypothetical protein
MAVHFETSRQPEFCAGLADRRFQQAHLAVSHARDGIQANGRESTKYNYEI